MNHIEPGELAIADLDILDRVSLRALENATLAIGRLDALGRSAEPGVQDVLALRCSLVAAGVPPTQRREGIIAILRADGEGGSAAERLAAICAEGATRSRAGVAPTARWVRAALGEGDDDTVADLDALQQRLGYQFRDAALLRLALTHPSVAHEQNQTAPAPTNQRLEFLGDAVLQLTLTQELYARFPAFGEGPLTKSRAKLVNARSLAAQARAIGLGGELLLGRGEELTGGRDRSSGLADAYEALLGAIFLDGGMEAAREFILREFRQVIGGLTDEPTIANPKGELQELLQAKSDEAPLYETVSATGPDHAREFECKVLHAGTELARGRGLSKKIAEGNAALAALEILHAEK